MVRVRCVVFVLLLHVDCFEISWDLWVWKPGPFLLLGIHGSLPYTITRLREIDMKSRAIA